MDRDLEPPNPGSTTPPEQGGSGTDRIVPAVVEPAGDDACWLAQLCPECGAVPEGAGLDDPTAPCWRCGAVRTGTATGEPTAGE